jgi:hypothetical protein
MLQPRVEQQEDGDPLMSKMTPDIQPPSAMPSRVIIIRMCVGAWIRRSWSLLSSLAYQLTRAEASTQLQHRSGQADVNRVEQDRFPIPRLVDRSQMLVGLL